MPGGTRRGKLGNFTVGISMCAWIVLSLFLSACGGVSQAKTQSTSSVGKTTSTSTISSGCGKDAGIQAGTSENETIAANPTLSSGNTTREFYIHLPVGYQPTQDMPLVLVFHGTGAHGSDMEQVTGLSQLADQRGFIVVYPQGLEDENGQTFWASIGTTQEGIDELNYVNDLLDTLEQRLCINEQRIYATGFSNGGGMSWDLACNLPERIAAFAPVSGNFYTLDTGCNTKKGVPILDVHGTGDTVVPYMGGPAPEKPDVPLPSIPQWLNDWSARDHCTRGPTTFLQSGNVTGEEWDDCQDGASVIHYRIDGGGHEWPTSLGSLSTSETIWNFFQEHPLNT